MALSASTAVQPTYSQALTDLKILNTGPLPVEGPTARGGFGMSTAWTQDAFGFAGPGWFMRVGLGVGVKERCEEHANA